MAPLECVLSSMVKSDAEDAVAKASVPIPAIKYLRITMPRAFPRPSRAILPSLTLRPTVEKKRRTLRVSHFPIELSVKAHPLPDTALVQAQNTAESEYFKGKVTNQCI